MLAYNQSTSKFVVKRPTLPFNYQIPNGLKAGQTLIVKGKVNYDAHRLEFNFNCGYGRDCDVACHFNPRFDCNKIVINAFTNGKWGTEEYSSMCFSKNQNFNLNIKIMPSSFEFSVDGRICYNYRCNFPLSRITTFNVEPGVHIKEFCILNIIKRHEQRPYIPSPTAPHPHQPFIPQPGMSQSYVQPRGSGGYSPSPGSYPPVPGEPYPIPPRYNPPTMKSYNVPYFHPIHGGLTAGRMIYISGYPKPSAKRFCINFVCRNHGSKDNAFHFNPRFSPDNCVVRNSESGGSWGREERVAKYFPFSPGVNFDIIIKVEQSRFMVAVNGVHFIEFVHRLLPIKRINSLEIAEDVQLTNVSFA